MQITTFIQTDKVLRVGQKTEIMVFDDTRSYFSRIEDIQDKSIILAMPTDPRGVPLVVSGGTDIRCKAFDGKYYYWFNSTFKSRSVDNIPLWNITKPVEVEKVQYRDFVRIKFSRDVLIRPVDEEGALGETEKVATVDVSGGGLCFSLDRPLPVGSKVSVGMDNVPEVGFFKAMTRVVHCIEIDVDGEKVYHIGVEFLDIERPVQNKLVRYLFDVQRKILAKGIDN